VIRSLFTGLVLLVLSALNSFGQGIVLPLWSDNVPNYRPADQAEICDTSNVIGISKVQTPTISVFLPSKSMATGQAVIICPGGGYRILAFDKEGTDIAKWLNSHGIAGIVLKYRLPDAETSIIRYKSPLLDAQRAIRMTRANAANWHLDKQKIGIMGFSAGGHLASTAGTHYDNGNSAAVDTVERFSCRPDFLILAYPVISMQENVTHRGSRRALLGENPDNQLIQRFSNELQVTKNTPQSFIFLASNDHAVIPRNSISFYEALIKNSISAEMHIFPSGGHGFGLAIGRKQLESWTECCTRWLKNINK